MQFNENLKNDDVNFYIQSTGVGNGMIHFAYKDDMPLRYSSDFFHVRQTSPFRAATLDSFRRVSTTKRESAIIHEPVVSFISSFSRGTVHGYSALWEMIWNYIQDEQDCKVLMYEKTQQGMIDIVSRVIGKEKIIFVKSDVVYLLKSAIFYPITQVHFADDFWFDIVEDIYEKYIVDDENDHEELSKLAIIKTHSSDNRTMQGVVSQDLVNTVCENNNFVCIDPSKHNECDTANMLYRSKELILSWGTSYYKNLRYISDACEKIHVLVFPGYQGQYNSRVGRACASYPESCAVARQDPKGAHSHMYRRYKNAEVKYILMHPNELKTFKVEKK